MIRSLLFLANMVILGIPSALLFISWCWLTGNVLPLYKATRFMLSSSCRVAGVRLRAQGLERIPRDRACVFMSNHVSNLDPPALISLIPGRAAQRGRSATRARQGHAHYHVCRRHTLARRPHAALQERPVLSR
jgi:1-acyl-sn-glycerol-3-phosphate acyltransferase